MRHEPGGAMEVKKMDTDYISYGLTRLLSKRTGIQLVPNSANTDIATVHRTDTVLPATDALADQPKTQDQDGGA